jgi:hypothetical protein
MNGLRSSHRRDDAIHVNGIKVSDDPTKDGMTGSSRLPGTVHEGGT